MGKPQWRHRFPGLSRIQRTRQVAALTLCWLTCEFTWCVQQVSQGIYVCESWCETCRTLLHAPQPAAGLHMDSNSQPTLMFFVCHVAAPCIASFSVFRVLWRACPNCVLLLYLSRLYSSLRASSVSISPHKFISVNPGTERTWFLISPRCFSPLRGSYRTLFSYLLHLHVTLLLNECVSFL